MELYALVAGKLHSLSPLHGLTAIGGARSSGVKLPGLKSDDDYCVATLTSERATVHSLKGKKRGQISLEPGVAQVIDDLTLCLLPRAVAEVAAQVDPFAHGFEELLRLAAELQDVRNAAREYSEESCAVCG